MSYLAKIVKPPTALIKLIEAIGIVLQVPLSYGKSNYKAPTPSNYDGTIALLLNDFVGCVTKLGSLASNDVSNEVASRLYSKILESGFDYEQAILSGGLESRDLYNCLILILNMLDSDPHRIPIKSINVMVLCDGSRPSYVALDLATHIHHHGICYITTLLIAGNDKINGTIIQNHLSTDLIRRCSEQYHLLPSQYQIDILQPHTSDDIIQAIDDTMCDHNCFILIIGIDANYIGTENLSKSAEWAAWKVGYITILVKSITRIRPFTSLKMNRKYLLCVKGHLKLQELFELCLQIIKPNDFLIVCSVVDNGEPLGDSRYGTRYDLGKRARWIAGKVDDLREPNRIGWNQKLVEELEENMRSLLDKSQITGPCPAAFHSLHSHLVACLVLLGRRQGDHSSP
jgi:hypothetical protein